MKKKEEDDEMAMNPSKRNFIEMDNTFLVKYIMTGKSFSFFHSYPPSPPPPPPLRTQTISYSIIVHHINLLYLYA